MPATASTRWPRVGVRIGTGRNAELIGQLRARELDAVIGRLSDPELMAGLSFEPLYAEPMVIVLRPGHALAPSTAAAKKAAVERAPRRTAAAAAPAKSARSAKAVRPAAPELARLGAHALVLPPAGTLIRQVADNFLRRHGVVPLAGTVETLDTALARALVLQTDNLWFTPRGAVQADLDSGALLRLGVDLTPEEAVGLMLRTEPSTSATLQTFIAAVRSGAAQQRNGRGRRGR